MEAKLAEYRLRKANEQQNKTSTVQKVFGIFRRTGAADGSHNKTDGDRQDSANQHQAKAETDASSTPDDRQEEMTEPLSPGKYRWLLLVLKTVLWLLVWAIFVELQFGAVFFVVSALLFVYINTRTGRDGGKKSLSAYSVFNPNCERLQGTITAEQFEAELLHRKPLAQT